MNIFGKSTIIAAALALLAMPALTLAASHEHAGHKEHMEHGKMEHAEHGKMEHGEHAGMEHAEHGKMEHGEHGGMGMLGKQSVDGVEAMFHMKAYDQAARAALAKAGAPATHHFMVFFTDEESGEQVTSGKVAIKITDPAGSEGAAIALPVMGKGFGKDLNLEGEGMYHFRLGTKLKDGKKRSFHTHDTVK